jgi:hypothetical protein
VVQEECAKINEEADLPPVFDEAAAWIEGGKSE